MAGVLGGGYGGSKVTGRIFHHALPPTRLCIHVGGGGGRFGEGFAPAPLKAPGATEGGAPRLAVFGGPSEPPSVSFSESPTTCQGGKGTPDTE